MLIYYDNRNSKQEMITMSVIDPGLRFPQCAVMLSHDEILAELKLQVAEKRFTQKALADHLGIAPPRIAEMLQGQRRIQPHELPKLVDWLGMQEDRPPAARPIPLLGEVPGGNWREAVRQSRRSIPSPDPSMPSSAYALRVVGDSMDLHVPDGAMIIVDPADLDLWPGRFYVVQNADGETTFKQYQESPARLVPCSSDPSHREMPISGGDFRVVGRVIWRASRM
ncbi:LexA family protein [Sphingobium yanoikuyae]|uniref:LexA family protein n=2 Tax=Sphingomonadaceae TaxID=41297 RepID=UPI0015F6A2CD|nr:S24 family peptidase [Sphingobium yanoikuyae]MDV3479859.1 S24 family peptidase [Sphingobium yanoikuyae]